MIEFLLTAGVSLVSGVLLALKAKSTNDLSVLGAALTRIYLFIVAMLLVIGVVTMWELYWAFTAVLIGDIINHTIALYSRKQYIDRLKNTTNKLMQVLETSKDKVFTINMAGEIEYANPAMMKEFPTQLHGRNLFALFNINKEEFMLCYEARIIYEGKIYQIKGFRTRNGHDTITGSIS